MKPLYYDNCYLKEFDTFVKEVTDERFIVLDNTAFYSVGGGQPSDTGKIICNNIEFNVISVKNNVHELDKQGIKVNDKVHCIIDWNKRYKLMRMHTAAHLLSSIIHKETNALITGNQLNEDKSRIDFSLDSFDKEKFILYVNEANIEIKKNKNIKIYYLPKQEAEKLTKLEVSNYNNEELRIIEIEDLDIQPCGGCHVKNTSEIGSIKLLSMENKGKNNRRLYFTLD